MIITDEKYDYVILSPRGVMQRIESEGRDERGIMKTRLTARKALDGWRNSRPNEANEIRAYRVNMGSFDSQWRRGDRSKVDLGEPVADL